ncbi:MAG: hotdog domain-containing protein [Planctomycetaceae bacterium]
MPGIDTTSHRLVLPADSNHYGTLYAGSLLRYALEAAYATAVRAAGPQATLVLRRVLSLECRRGVPVGTLVEIRGAVLQVRQSYVVVGVAGMPLEGHSLPWMDGLFGFANVDASGGVIDLPGAVEVADDSPLWQPLVERLGKLAAVRGATADWLAAGW